MKTYTVTLKSNNHAKLIDAVMLCRHYSKSSINHGHAVLTYICETQGDDIFDSIDIESIQALGVDIEVK